MIGRLTGTIVECSPGEVLLDVAGVGYSLQIPLSTFYALATDGSSGSPVSLHVHTHVREDALQLFGFFDPLERAVFEQLIGISGVGPRLALAILSGIGANELEQAVERQDRARLEHIPGVGKKTAARLLLELRDRLSRATAGRSLSRSESATDAAACAGQPRAQNDAVSALVNLGYRQEKASRAVDAALERLGSQAGLEALLKAALGRIVG
jgi:Holliday junction DNA helicase RuvA